MQKRQALLQLAQACANFDGTCLLLSGGPYESAEKSFLALFPYQNAEASLDTWDPLKEALGPLSDSQNPHPQWFGFIEYEGMACFQKYAAVIELDHRSDEWEIHLNEDRLDASQLALLRDPKGWAALPPIAMSKATTYNILQPLETEEAYLTKVRQALEYIYAGEVYQVNLSHKMTLEGSWNAFELFTTLTDLNPAPFSAYLKLRDRTLISTSPERFLHKRGSLLEARPIKGTAPRGKSPADDAKLKGELLQSPKELAELLMITDLLRNDLAMVSDPGSVAVAKLWHCEAYANVFHLLSVIQANAKKGWHPADILKSCFPGGSITGCPKKRAMEIIQELESSPRGIYTGSIGYFAGNGDFDFNIAIRTAEIRDNRLTLRLGGGVVADSDPHQEYQETLHKGRSFFNALGITSLSR